MKKLLFLISILLALAPASLFASGIWGGGGGGGGTGNVSTDTLWDAAGDLAVGTGPNTAGRLPIGSVEDILKSDGTTTQWTSSPSVATLTARSASSITVGTDSAGSGPAIGSIIFHNATNTNHFSLISGTTGAALSWTLPIAAPGGNNYLVAASTAGVLSYATTSANMISLLGSADYATARTNLGLAIGTNVQAYDADLTTYAGITPSANVQTLLGSADYAAMRTNLGLAIGSNVQAYDAELTTIAAMTATTATTITTPGTSGNVMKSDGTNWTSSNSLSIANFDMTSGTSSIPWIISATAPTTEGQGAWNSTTDILYIGDGAASVAQVGVGKTNVYDVDPIPIHWATNGTTAPTAAPTWLTSTNKARYQDFAGDADSDVTFEWTVPYGINATVAPTFQVEGWITAATVPATTETAKFVLACRSYSDNDPLSGAMSVTPVTVTYTFATAYARYDRWVSGYSGALSITDLAAGELVICNLKRDTTDTYAQPLGVSWIKMKFAKKLQGS